MITTDPGPPRHVAAFRVLSGLLVAAAVGAAVWWTVDAWDVVRRVADGIRPWLASLVGISL
jgi:hypothetical protein